MCGYLPSVPISVQRSVTYSVIAFAAVELIGHFDGDSRHLALRLPPAFPSVSTAAVSSQAAVPLEEFRARSTGIDGPTAASGNDSASAPLCEGSSQTPAAPPGGFTHTVALSIPYRDRSTHLAAFRAHWRVFANNTGVGAKRVRWEVYVVEQLDNGDFKRGWLLNVGFALALGLSSASPDVGRCEQPVPDCYVTQDVDMLPMRGVDYTDCKAGIAQLCTSIDRYRWGPPSSFGGVVTASPHDWMRTNGYSNDFTGWGAEDVDWKKRMDFSKVKARRVRAASGRFTTMRLDHTVRISSQKAFNHNTALLREASAKRLAEDGMSNLAFRIVDSTTDTSDSDVGISIHHVRVVMGKRTMLRPRETLIAVPRALCKSAADANAALQPAGEWAFQPVGDNAFDHTRLLARALEVARGKGWCSSNSIVPPMSNMTLLALDVLRRVVKVVEPLSDDLSRFYRSLKGAPGEGGMLVVDARPEQSLRAAFATDRRLRVFPVFLYICGNHKDQRWAVSRGKACDRSIKVGNNAEGTFSVFKRRKPGTEAISVCQNDMTRVHRLVRGEVCDPALLGENWAQEMKFYAPSGDNIVVCTSTALNRDQIIASIGGASAPCASGFKQHFTFGLAPMPNAAPVHSAARGGKDMSVPQSRQSEGFQLGSPLESVTANLELYEEEAPCYDFLCPPRGP